MPGTSVGVRAGAEGELGDDGDDEGGGDDGAGRTGAVEVAGEVGDGAREATPPGCPDCPQAARLTVITASIMSAARRTTPSSLNVTVARRPGRPQMRMSRGARTSDPHVLADPALRFTGGGRGTRFRGRGGRGRFAAGPAACR